MLHLSFYFMLSGQLRVSVPYISSSEEGISIGFRRQRDDKRRESLCRLAGDLKRVHADWLKPFRFPTEEWILDANKLKTEISDLEKIDWFNGVIKVTPDYDYQDIVRFGKRVKETNIRFICTPSEIRRSLYMNQVPELQPSLDRFYDDHPDPQTCGFLMMKFQDSVPQRKIVKALRNSCQQHGLTLLRADDREYSNELLSNIRTYMHGCHFGVAVFDRLISNEFNPNVALEVGYMMALGKDVCLLKDATLPSLHTDLVGALYKTFDPFSPQETIPTVLEAWLRDRGIIQT